MKASYIISRVRQHLDQVPLEEEDVKTDSAIVASPTTEFSDEDLFFRVLLAQRAVVNGAKAMHVQPCITQYTGPLPTIDLEYERFLYGRVVYNGEEINTSYEPYDPQGYYEGVPGGGTNLFSFVAAAPTNILSLLVSTGTDGATDSGLTVYLNNTAVGTVTLSPLGDGNHVVSVPEINMVDTDVLKVKANAGIDHGDIFMSFTGEVAVLTAEDVANRRAVQRSADRHRRMEGAGRNATPRYPVYTMEDGHLHIYPDDVSIECYLVVPPQDLQIVNLAQGTDDLTVDERFTGALIHYVAATCFETMGATDQADLEMADFNDEMDAFALYNRLNVLFDDREMDVE